MNYMQLSEELQKKIRTYLGFGIRAGKVVYGTDNIICLKKGALILIDTALSDNSKNKLNNFAVKTGSTVFIIENVTALGAPSSCKALALKEQNLASEIIKLLESNK